MDTYTIKKQQAAFIAGFSILLMAILAGFSYGYVHTKLIFPEDPEKTLFSLSNSASLFGIEIIGWVLILILDILVAVNLFQYFFKTHKQLAYIGSFFRILYTLFLGCGIFQLIQVFFRIVPLNLENLSKSSNLIFYEEFTLTHLHFFDKIWSYGLIFFGIHLLLISYLSIISKAVPKILCGLLTLAGASYLFIHICNSFFPTVLSFFPKLEQILAIPMAIGELSFGVFLLLLSRKKSK